MAELAREQRLQIMLKGEELHALDTWRFQKRMPAESTARNRYSCKATTAPPQRAPQAVRCHPRRLHLSVGHPDIFHPAEVWL